MAVRARRGAEDTAPGRSKPCALICWQRRSRRPAASQRCHTSRLPDSAAGGGAAGRVGRVRPGRGVRVASRTAGWNLASVRGMGCHHQASAPTADAALQLSAIPEWEGGARCREGAFLSRLKTWDPRSAPLRESRPEEWPTAGI